MAEIPAAFLNHSAWNVGRVFIGPDAMDQAMAVIKESWLADDNTRKPEDFEAAFESSFGSGEFDDWTIEDATHY